MGYTPAEALVVPVLGLWLSLGGCDGGETADEPLHTDPPTDSDVEDTDRVDTAGPDDTDDPVETDPPDTDPADTAPDDTDSDAPDSDVGETDPPDTGDPCDPTAPDVPNRRDDDCDGVIDRDDIGALALASSSSAEEDERITSIDNLASGDVTGDGAVDVIVGAPFQDGDRGRVYVLDAAGWAAWSDVTADATFTLEAENAGDELGFVPHAFGDLDGDGHDDLVAGARGHAEGGRAYVWLGGPRTGTSSASDADGIVQGIAAGNSAGWALDGSSDLDGDGRADLAVGDAGSQGLVALFSGGVSGSVSLSDATASVTGDTASAFGEMVQSGDVDSDGYADLIAGAPGVGGAAGAVYVFAGGAALPDGEAADLAWMTVAGTGAGAVGGNSRGTARPADLDDSGRNDLAVADYLGQGAVYVFLDPSGGSASTTDAEAVLQERGTGLGSCVLTGDLDGDGVADLLAGGIYDGTTYPNGGVLVAVWGGAAFAPGASWSRATAPVLVEATAANQYVGTAAALPGDVTGDGRPDLLIGASWDDTLAREGGTVFLLR